MKYKHITLEQREKLYALREQSLTFREIAKELGKSHTTWSREYKRHAKYGKNYVPCKAQAQAEKKAYEQHRKAPLKNPKVFLYVRQKLRCYWTPEEIAGRLPIDHPGESIHHETIYRYIYSKKKTTHKMKLWGSIYLFIEKRE